MMRLSAMGRYPFGPLLCLALASGCSSTDELPTCQYRVCPIQDGDCVEHVAQVVACNMEVEATTPTVRFLTRAELLEETQSRREPPTDEEAKAIDDYVEGIALMGLMPTNYDVEEAVADSLANVAGVYNDGEIIILTDRAATDETRSYLLLVHEMVHLYQDRRWGIGEVQAQFSSTRDRALAVNALIEGHASLIASLADLELRNLAPNEAQWPPFFADWQTDALKRAQATETPYLDAQSLFVYPFGTDFVWQGWSVDNDLIFDRLFSDPPESVLQVLGGYTAWRDGLIDNGDAAFDPRALPLLPSDYELTSAGHESVWALNAMMQRKATSGLWAEELESVSSDYLSVFRFGANELAAVWRIHSTEVEALSSRLLDSIATVWTADYEQTEETPFFLAVEESDIILIAVSAGDARTVFDAIEGWGPPPAP